MGERERRAVEILADEAEELRAADRYAEMLRAAESAVDAARAAGALDLEIRSVCLEASALSALGDKATALQRYTWILTIAADQQYREELARHDVTWHVAVAYMDWVECARFLPEIPAAELFRVIDAGEAYLRGVGKAGWRAGLLSARASVLETLGRRDEAVAPAEEALALKLRHRRAPGYTLATYRSALGDLLLALGRPEQAAPHYQAVLEDITSDLHGRKVAHTGLAWCALEGDDPAAACREAKSAVRLAEGMGDEQLTTALAALTEACRAAGDRVGARRAAERHVACARRTGSDYGLYFALRDAADVALDEGQAVEARALLDEVGPLADLLDRQSGLTTVQAEIAQRRERLAQLETQA